MNAAAATALLARWATDPALVPTPVMEALSAVVRLEAERDEARRLLGEVHRRVGRGVGWPDDPKRTYDCILSDLAARDETHGEVEAEMKGERDEARAEVERLTKNATAREGVSRRRLDALRPTEAVRDDAQNEARALRVERDRLALVLRCERGEWAPEGWRWKEGPSGQHFGVGEWRKTTSTTGVPNAIVHQNSGAAKSAARWAWHVRDPNAGGFAPTAIDAIEAADNAAKVPHAR